MYRLSSKYYLRIPKTKFSRFYKWQRPRRYHFQLNEEDAGRRQTSLLKVLMEAKTIRTLLQDLGGLQEKRLN
ncbi:hypothetical protein CEXT_639161 [Caerostris extrusa]|uniref:Uncharacterized protein n=1 Tax=Caerostris extrusa TaxID=172846 RepID=A0AAV4WNU8_CAEEX|nr:hypothetical protein CEXT_639161 [Caerostris extrusa]